MKIIVKVFGYTSVQIETLINSITSSNLIDVNISEKYLDAKLEIENLGLSEVEFNKITSEIFLNIKDNMYCEGDKSLGQMVIEYLNFTGKRLAVAESLTGGMISDSIVKVDGASRVFNEGIVTYSNDSKIKRLGVSRYTIESNGAVSFECAYEMANGLLKNLNTDIAVSTTGIAGPTGGSKEKPVGLVYMSIADRVDTKVYNHCFKGDRETVRHLATNTALFYLINRLKNRF